MPSASGWRVDELPSPDGTWHIWPDGDLVDHELVGDGCVCGPTAKPIVRDDGSIAWMTVHAALDGRP